MFKSSEGEQVASFLRVLSQLEAATKTKSPKRVNDSLAYILARAADFGGKNVEQLAVHLCATKPLPKRRTRSSKTTTTTPPLTQAELNGILSYLNVAAVDIYRFKDVVDQYEKDLNAQALKTVAAAFARAPKPKTKADAVRLLVAARNDRARSERKAAEAGHAKPW